jgi:hypothetical protein
MANLDFTAQEDWTVTDLQVFFHQLNILYNRLYVIASLKPGRRGRLEYILSSSLSQVPEQEQLLVDFIEIHSPAKFSLKGVDDIIGQLRGLIRDLWYDNRLDKKNKEQALQHKEKLNELELANHRAALLERQIDIMKKAGFSDEEIRENTRKLTDPLERILVVMQQREVSLVDKDQHTGQ